MRFGVILFTLVSACFGVQAAPHLKSESSALLNAPEGNSLNVTVGLEKRAGQGGYINLINGGSYTWNLGAKNSYQMNAFGFPSTVAPYSAARVYLEFKTGGQNLRSKVSV